MNHKINLFIVDDNKSMVSALKNYVKQTFGEDVNISTFDSGEACLEKIDKTTHIVLLDYNMNGISGLDTIKLIKDINPDTSIIMLTSLDNKLLSKMALDLGASNYIVKGHGSWTKISGTLKKLIYPICYMFKEFAVHKYVIMFVTTFLIMGGLVYLVLQLMK